MLIVKYVSRCCCHTICDLPSQCDCEANSSTNYRSHNPILKLITLHLTGQSIYKVWSLGRHCKRFFSNAFCDGIKQHMCYHQSLNWKLKTYKQHSIYQQHSEIRANVTLSLLSWEQHPSNDYVASTWLLLHLRLHRPALLARLRSLSWNMPNNLIRTNRNPWRQMDQDTEPTAYQTWLITGIMKLALFFQFTGNFYHLLH